MSEAALPLAGIRVVELGATDGDKVAILKGLQVGDQVVIDGVDRLRDGAKIRKPAPAGGAIPKPATDGAGASAAPSTSDAPSSKTAPQTGEAPAPGQQRRGNGERRANGATDRPAQTNQ